MFTGSVPAPPPPPHARTPGGWPPDSEGVRGAGVGARGPRAGLRGVVALGETGLDYYRLNGRSVEQMEWQRERFRVHIRAARATALPLVVHTRSASADTVALLRRRSAGG